MPDKVRGKPYISQSCHRQSDNAVMSAEFCPCDLQAPYATCCGQFHGGAHAPTAVALMRSRYSAYVLDDLGYLQRTWHPRTRPPALSANPPGLRWLRLQMVAHDENADRATVQFVAVSKLDGRAQRMAETSRFVRESGAWLYVDGDVK